MVGPNGSLFPRMRNYSENSAMKKSEFHEGVIGLAWSCLARSKGSHHADRFEEDGKSWELQRHVSFVDCPGHDILMATMLNGAAVS